VWGYTPERHVDTRVVDVHISRLRAKLEDDPSKSRVDLREVLAIYFKDQEKNEGEGFHP